MTEPHYLLDTHALFWYELADPQLSQAASAIFTEAEQGRAILALSYIVLAEFYYILRKLDLDTDFPAYLASVESNPIYRVEPIVWGDIRQLSHHAEIPEMHDRLIVIQAIRLGATLVTRDRMIQTSAQVSWVW